MIETPRGSARRDAAASGHRATFPPLSHRSHLGPLSILGVLTIALGYAVLEDGGMALSDWNISLLIFGLVALMYWVRTPTASPALSMTPWLRRAVALFP